MAQYGDVVAYQFQADLVCPDCVVPLLFDLYRQPFPRAPHVTTEAKLGVLARRIGIDYRDVHSYDSDQFPKAVLYGQPYLEAGATCSVCHAELEGSENNFPAPSFETRTLRARQWRNL